MICEFCKADLEKRDHFDDCVLSGEPMTKSATLETLFSHGWECPNCLRIYSPITSECETCNKDKK